jgi:hypothetical protein
LPTAELASGSDGNQAFSYLGRENFRNLDSKRNVSFAVDHATVKLIGDKLGNNLPPPETKSSKVLRRLLVKLERSEREQNTKPH